MRPVTTDSVMHLLAEHHAPSLLDLIGLGGHGPPRSTKPPAEIVDPDCLWDLGHCLVNLEMERSMDADMAWRMFEYRARIRRRADLRDRPLLQHVLVLRDGSPPGRPRSGLDAGPVGVVDHGQAWFTYQIHLVRNLDPEHLLTDPATAVFAPLGRASTGARVSLLGQAARRILAADMARSRLRGMLEFRFGPAAASVDDEVIDRLLAEADPVAVIAVASSLEELRPDGPLS